MKGIKDNPVIWVMGLAVASFALGFGAYDAILRVGSLTTVSTVELAQLRAMRDPLNAASCADYDVKTIAPQRPVPANADFDVQATTGRLPKGFAVWLVTTSERGPREGYWGPRRAKLADAVWTVTVPKDKTGKSGDTKYYAIFVVGEDGEKLIRAYRDTMKYFAPNAEKPWPTFREFTSDMMECPQLIAVRFN